MSTTAAGASSNAGSSTIRWQFINQSNDRRSNLTQVKRHVMREYMRQKKEEHCESRIREINPVCASKRMPPNIDRGTKQEIRHGIETQNKLLNDSPAFNPFPAVPFLGPADYIPYNTPPFPSQTICGFFSYHQNHMRNSHDIGPFPFTPDTLINYLQAPETTLATSQVASLPDFSTNLDLESVQIRPLRDIYGSLWSSIPFNQDAYLLNAYHSSEGCEECRYLANY
ncbi:hypothetical protein N7455_009259 [Penicillium solitum]|uniref:uncharacterized protein n=1 Tax=Penicillium solitum TaxID=60172 RepID=UPI00185E988F|nr:hypothetical protein HAV15_012284 [Penicillium sp. str. \